MNRIALALSVAAACWALPATAQHVSDDAVRNAMIKDSINAYRGNCPCPYNYAANGSLCGGRSAYSRPSGASPLCFPKDITPNMLEQYRQSHRIP
jgi:hypothetical protein